MRMLLMGLLAILFLFAVGVIASSAGLLPRRQIYTEISIYASAETVWEILVNFQEYPDWNPFIRRVSGEASEGAQLNVTVQPAGDDPMDFQPTVLAAREHQELRWLGRLLVPGLFDGEHYFRIEEAAEGQVKFVHGEEFNGMLALLLWGILEPGTKKGFEAMNLALKNRAEISEAIKAGS